jgi:hypothetical protein
MSEARIERLDEDVRDIKATLARFEPMIVRIDATLRIWRPRPSSPICAPRC